MAVKLNVTDVSRVDAEPDCVVIHVTDTIRGEVEMHIPTAEFWAIYRSVVPVFPNGGSLPHFEE
jgi:hypothetical protein